jgi:superoxide dismutase, Fe-Mn family
MNRRTALKTAVVLSTTPLLFATARAEEKPKGFTLEKLPYDYKALEPSIDEETMTIHHTKHHQAYITNLNDALTKEAPDWLSKPIDDVISGLAKVPDKIRTTVRNNAGGHWNHTFFWASMAPVGKGGELKGDLLKAIETSFKSVDEFKKEFATAATKRFGSGWAWLVPNKNHGLVISSTPNQDNPQMDGQPKPLLGLDVWEHAYYLKYRNKRADYITAWWNIVNWDAVSARFAEAHKG